MFGADSDAAARALIGALGNDTSAQVRAVAAQALGSGASVDVRSAAAAMGLGKIGQPAGGAVQALQAAQAQDSDPGVRAAAARAIQLITNTQ